jgi:hypothetical protein
MTEETIVEVLEEWNTEEMLPGVMFILENAGETGEKEDPYWAVLSCPTCGTIGLITRKQINGFLPIMCGSTDCSAWFELKSFGGVIVHIKPF